MKKWSTEIKKIVNLYYENNIFLLSGYFNIRWLWDAYRVPTWMDFGFKNPPKSALGRLLGRLVAVLGRLGPSWRRLGAPLARLGALLGPKKSRDKLRVAPGGTPGAQEKSRRGAPSPLKTLQE